MHKIFLSWSIDFHTKFVYSEKKIRLFWKLQGLKALPYNDVKGQHKLTIFLDNFSTSQWWNSTRNEMLWFNSINSSNHDFFFFSNFIFKVNAPICANLRLNQDLKIQKFVVKLFFRGKFSFIY